MIRVIDNYVIIPGSDCFTVGEETTTKDKDGNLKLRVPDPKYFPTFQLCLEYICRRIQMDAVRGGDFTLREAVDAMTAAADRFTAAVNALPISPCLEEEQNDQD